MPFYPDDESEKDSDFQVKNKYDSEGRINFSNDDSFLEKENNLDDVGGIDRKELRKRIEDFKLKDEEIDSFTQDEESSDTESIDDEKKVKKIKTKDKEYYSVKNGTLGWYTKMSRWPIIIIVLFNILIVFRGYFANSTFAIADFTARILWIDFLKWPIEILVFLFVSYFIVRKENQLPKIAGISCAIIGLASGVLIALFKLFWYREMWNIFYLSNESIFLAFIGFIIGLLSASLFYKERFVNK